MGRVERGLRLRRHEEPVAPSSVNRYAAPTRRCPRDAESFARYDSPIRRRIDAAPSARMIFMRLARGRAGGSPAGARRGVLPAGGPGDPVVGRRSPSFVALALSPCQPGLPARVRRCGIDRLSGQRDGAARALYGWTPSRRDDGAEVARSALTTTRTTRRVGSGAANPRATPWAKIGLLRGCSSIGRALRSQCRGSGFESHHLHHEASTSMGGLPFLESDESTPDVVHQEGIS